VEVDMSDRAEKSPFSLYDFMGYIIPGMLFLTFLSLIYLSIRSQSTMYGFIFKTYEKLTQSPLKSTLVLELGVVGGLSFIALSAFYLAGHFIAALSHVLIDRILVFSLLKYPILVRLDLVNDEDRDYPKMLINLLLFISVIAIYVLITVHYLFEEVRLIFIVKSIILCLIAGFISLRLVLPAIWKAVYAAFHPNDPNNDKCKIIQPDSWLYKVMKWVYRLLESLILTPLKKALFLDREFDSEFKERVKEGYRDLFYIKPENSKTNVYWLMHYHVLNKNEKMEAYQTNWLRLYGLCRNVTCASFLVIVFQIFLSFKYTGIFTSPPSLQVCVVCIIISPIFLIRYLVLYYNYYTKNLIRSFYILTNDRDSSKNGILEV